MIGDTKIFNSQFACLAGVRFFFHLVLVGVLCTACFFALPGIFSQPGKEMYSEVRIGRVGYLEVGTLTTTMTLARPKVG